MFVSDGYFKAKFKPERKTVNQGKLTECLNYFFPEKSEFMFQTLTVCKTHTNQKPIL